MSHTELLGQALHAIGQVLGMQQKQGTHQQEWIQRNLSLFKMLQMTKDDDPEAYIESFKQTALQMGSDRTQWAHQLGALVVDKAQAVYRSLLREDACNYEMVKAAILYYLEKTPENYRLPFYTRKS